MLRIFAIAAALVSAQSGTVTLPSADIQRDVEAAVTLRLRDADSSARVLGVSGVRDQSLPMGLVTLDVGAIAGRWPRARAGVPVLVSKSMPTVHSAELAAEYGLQLVCGRKFPKV